MTAQIKNRNAAKKFLVFAMAFLLLAVVMPVRVYANSAEPPSMVIWSVNAPSD